MILFSHAAGIELLFFFFLIILILTLIIILVKKAVILSGYKKCRVSKNLMIKIDCDFMNARLVLKS